MLRPGPSENFPASYRNLTLHHPSLGPGEGSQIPEDLPNQCKKRKWLTIRSGNTTGNAEELSTSQSNLDASSRRLHLHLCEEVCWLVGASVKKKKYRRLGGTHNRNVFSRSSGGRKPQIQVESGLVSSEASFLG